MIEIICFGLVTKPANTIDDNISRYTVTFLQFKIVMLISAAWRMTYADARIIDRSARAGLALTINKIKSFFTNTSIILKGFVISANR